MNLNLKYVSRAFLVRLKKCMQDYPVNSKIQYRKMILWIFFHRQAIQETIPETYAVWVHKAYRIDRAVVIHTYPKY